ncbi:hypothetical protein AMK59_84 [Oryctes borbonicus]|uniref:Membrane transporter n=1 Tax=Oryctes borbonicus TaxID=1629725 RepID=A0A0T6BG84_9SCAR|nr:hypothetical protein AMK59_84 [Oryctes borbonicus]
MTQTMNTSPKKKIERCELVPPEGGWGYMVTIAVSLTFIVTIVPTTVFGTVFGPFLSSLGDATGATTLINGVFNTVLCLAGNYVNKMESFISIGCNPQYYFSSSNVVLTCTASTSALAI